MTAEIATRFFNAPEANNRGASEIASALFPEYPISIFGLYISIRNKRVLEIASGTAEVAKQLGWAAESWGLADIRYKNLGKITELQQIGTDLEATQEKRSRLHVSPLDWRFITNRQGEVDPQIKTHLPDIILSSYGWPFWVTKAFQYEYRKIDRSQKIDQLPVAEILEHKLAAEHIFPVVNFIWQVAQERDRQGISARRGRLHCRFNTIIPHCHGLTRDPIAEAIVDWCNKVPELTARIEKGSNSKKVLIINSTA